MPQFLLELLSEEIPARMQAGAARDLERLAREGLAKTELAFESMRAFAGPRRLTLVVDGLPARQADRSEERRGPRLGAPEAAVEGFLRSTGLSRQALAERDGFHVARLSRAGGPTGEILAQVAEGIVRRFPWPKSMSWGDGRLRWVRPLRRILCVFDGRIAPLSINGLEAGDLSEGHRSMGGRAPIRARDFEAYREALAAHFVVLDVEERKRRIEEGARAVCAARGLEPIPDPGLLEEVAGMVEWPVPLLGHMDERFLDLPAEVVRTSMRTHQRYFAVRRPGEERLAPHFVAVANLETPDGGALIAAGNARVLAARLDDARFFWDEDRKVTLEQRLERLAGVTFHAKLGSMRERAARLEELARAIAPLVGADPDLAAQAGRLAKADLVTGMVGEFPELQGVMGGHYARAEGLAPAIASAIAEHYRPQGLGDQVPKSPEAVAVALAEKMDSIVGFFSIGEAPTGSRDPFALRRAALGVIRIVLHHRLRVGVGELQTLAQASSGRKADGVAAFFADRLKGLLRDEGARHDLVDAVFALGDDHLVRVVARIEALGAFLATPEGADLLAGYKRASNILAAEEKKGPLPTRVAPRVETPAEEAALHDALSALDPKVDAALEAEDYAAAMAALAALRTPVDRFFEAVLVNSADPAERTGRLALLVETRKAMGRVADFSLVAG